MEISPAGMAHQDAYRVFMSIVVPRPIAWVSTISLDGVDNLAPFSMYEIRLRKTTPWPALRLIFDRKHLRYTV